MRRILHRIHIWLGWLIGVPLLIWTVTGLWMVARPIEEVRGVHLKAKPPILSLEKAAVPPFMFGKFPDVQSMRLEQQWTGPMWVVSFADGSERRASALDGRWLSLSEAEARAIADGWYLPKSAIVSVRKTAANAPPIDLRKDRPAWGVTFADGAHVYVDADTGGLLAIRSGQWRAFDFMWGLHIMDLQSREDTHHPVLIFFAAMAALSVLLALILLPLSQWRKRKRAIS